MTVRQLTITITGEDILERIACEALERGIDDSHVQAACSVVARRFSALMHVDVDRIQETRLHAYFAGVLRRRVMRSRGAELRAVRQRSVLRTMAEDLARAGVSHDRIVVEIADVYDEAMPLASLRAIAEEASGYAKVS